VRLFKTLVDSKDLAQLNWPILSVCEGTAVTESTSQGSRLAVGGSAIMKKRALETGERVAAVQG